MSNDGQVGTGARALSKAPRLVRIYVIFLFCLPVVYLIGTISSSGAQDALIRELQGLRFRIFGVCAFSFLAAGILFLKRKPAGRAFVLVGILAHLGYIVYYDLRQFAETAAERRMSQTEELASIETAGLVILMAMVIALFTVLGTIPFAPRFSTYLRGGQNEPETNDG